MIRERAVGDGFREELTILNHDEYAGGAGRSGSTRARLRRPVRGEERRGEEGQVLHRVEPRTSCCSATGGRRSSARRSSRRPATPKIDKSGLTYQVRSSSPTARWATELSVATRVRGGPGRMPLAGATSSRRPRPGGAARRRADWPQSLERWLADAPKLECDRRPAEGDLPAQPGRPRGAAVRPAGRRRAQPAGRRPALVHDHVRPGQHLHQPAGAAVRPRAGPHHAAGARRLAGHRAGRLPRRGPRPDPARDALRRDGGVRGAAALAVLRQRRRHRPVRGAARRVRAVDRRPGAGPRAGVRGPGGAATGSTSTPTCRAPGTSTTSAATRRPGWRTSAGRTPGTPSATATVGCPASRAPPASCRATRTTRRCAAPGWPGWPGTTRRTPTGSRRRRPTSSAGSTATSGSPTAQYYALALDADGTQVDALSSNIGHLLWSGIVDVARPRRSSGT